MITQDEYQSALQTIKSYREERGLDFYLPINFSTNDETITMEEFKQFISLQKALQ